MIVLLIIIAIAWYLVTSIRKRNVQSKQTQAETEQQKKELEGKIKDFDKRQREFETQESELSLKITNFNDNKSLKEKLTKELLTLKEEKHELERDISRLDQEYTDLYKNSLVPLDIDEITSSEIKNRLSTIKNKEKNTNLLNFEEAYFETQRKKNHLKRMILLPFDSEVNGILNKLSIANIDQSRNKIWTIFTKLNNAFSSEHVQLTQDAIDIKLDELELSYQFIIKKNDEKEQQRAIREQMVEEEKARRELENEQSKILKEEKQFNNQLSKLLKYLSASTNDIQSQLYSDQISELKSKISDLEAKKVDITNRQLNTRAGFVYVISNIGSFGEDVYKIGMTKRLNPMDRINELGSASVPFTFDVHAMIFSEDAPSLETKLHSILKNKSINKINYRKEFFRVTLLEIKEAVEKTHNGIIEYTELARAEEYRRSLEIK